MRTLEERLRAYADQRANRISSHEANLVVTRALEGRSRRSSWTRHSINGLAAIALSALLVVGGIVLGLQLHGLRTGSKAPTPGPLPKVPDELLYLDDLAPAFDQVTPYRLRAGQVLPPRPRFVVAPGTAVTVVGTALLCDHTVVRVTNLDPQPKDVLAPVSLPGCYSSPTLVPNSTLILLDHMIAADGTAHYVGTDAYDWKAGRIARSYNTLGLGFGGGLVSADGKVLYTLNAAGEATSALQITDLVTGGQVATVYLNIAGIGLNSGGLALSPDGRTLYVNEGTSLQAFDAHTGKAGGSMPFKDSPGGATSLLPGWLAAWLPRPLDAEAKEGFEPGHGIALDPSGRWVAGLGIDDPAYEGVWVFDTSTLRLIRRISNASHSLHSGFRGLAASLDGSVIYALYVEAQRGSIEVIDPHSGRMRVFSSSRFSDLNGIAGVEPASG